MNNLEKNIRKLTKLKVHSLLDFILVILLFTIGLPTIVSSGLLVVNLQLISWKEANDLLGLFTGLFITLPLVIYVGYWILTTINPFKKIQNNLWKLNDLRKDVELKKEEFDEILYISQILQQYLKNINSSLYFSFVLSKKSRTNLNEIQQIILEVSHEILIDLRSDLSIRLAEQGQILEGAKKEIQENIHGTAVLDTISELQGVRLNKQIEQFEELQRILI